LVFVVSEPSNQVKVRDLYSEQSGYQGNKKKSLIGTTASPNQEKVLSWLSRQKKGRLLDIGCSNGEFMWLAKEAGFEVLGVELNKRTADIARGNGLNVISGFLEDAGFADNSFDYVYMGDLIEHVESPNALMEQVKRVLRQEGKVVIVTPNLDCFWSKATYKLYQWFGIPWSSLTPPYHLFQFSTLNLDSLMSHYGFTSQKHMYGLPPRLSYELGSLHLLKRYKQGKTILSLVFMCFSFFLYAVVYVMNFASKPFREKDLSVIGMYGK
jgi:SAM-dependent methyltransferase